VTPTTAIRFAMMAGVLLFGGVSWFVHRSPDWMPANTDMVESLVTVARIMWMLVGAGLVVLYWKSRDAESAAQLSTIAILAWALGEILALYGGVLYFQSARSGWYIAGVMALAFTFVVFPGRRTT
jgi:hypothetical protein